MGNAVYGFSVFRMLQSSKTAKNLRVCYNFQLVKLSNHNMRRLFCHFIPVDPTVCQVF